jgi:hypothetical protein
MAENGNSYDWEGEGNFVTDKRVSIEALSLRI